MSESPPNSINWVPQKSATGPRVAYVKNGDACAQINRLRESPRPLSGPDAFIADFLLNVDYSQLLVLSRDLREDNVAFEFGRSRTYRDGLTSGTKAIFRIRAFLGVLMAIIRFRADRVVCGCMGSRLWASYLAAKVLRVPLVLSRHNMAKAINLSRPRRAFQRLDQYCLNAANAVICHGPFLVDEIRSLGIPEERVLSFEVDLRDWSDDRPNAGLPSTDRSDSKARVVFVGRLEAEKGVFDLLEAMAPLLRTHPGISLEYVGGGGAEDRLKRRIQEMALAERVRVLGPKSHNEVKFIVRNARVVVAPTRPEFPEGRCMSVLEALALGVPAIGPAFGPFPYLIKDASNGWLFEPGSVPDLRNKLSDALIDERIYQPVLLAAREGRSELSRGMLSFGQAVTGAFAVAHAQRTARGVTEDNL